MSTYESALAKAGGATGLGLGSLLGGVSDVLSAPRRLAWSALGLGENGSDLIRNVFQGAIDPEGMTGTILGNVAEMALDPLNLLTAGGGAALGKAAGKGLDISKHVATNRSLLAAKLGEMTGEKAAIGELGAIAKGAQAAPEAIQNWPSPLSKLWRVPEAELNPRVGLVGGLENVGKRYGRVNPAALESLEKSGYGVRSGKGALLTMDEKPAFVKGAGGTLQRDPLMRVPDYSARFDAPRNVGEMFGRGEERLTSLASRLGQSGSMLEAPIGEVAGQASRRLQSLGLDEEMFRSMLGKLNDTPMPFNIGANPRISADLLNTLSNAHVGSVATAMSPLLFSQPRRTPQSLEMAQM